MYGFSSINKFKHAAILAIEQEKPFYLSSVYQILLEQNKDVEYIEFTQNTKPISTIMQMKESINKKTIPSLRICVDLDNTLVTQPRKPDDYTTVEPIEQMIQFTNQLKQEGHTIIIYTARRMRTHKGNTGRLMKDIGLLTFQQLEQFQIEYDEIYFGKPDADVYIDDKAFNPYINKYTLFGLFQENFKEPILNCLPTNTLNQLEKQNEIIIKKGPRNVLDGQAYYYEQIPKDLTYFPKCYKTIERGDTIELELEYIKGIPLFYLLKHSLFTEKHLEKLFELLEHLHSISMDTNPSKPEILGNYIVKLNQRLSNSAIYYFKTVKEIKDYCIQELMDSISKIPIKSVSIIHGDFWLSNILLTYTNEIKCLDMRGKLGNCLTLGGDPLYDYAKLYQSILGYDCMLWNTNYDKKYRERLIQFFNKKVKNIRGIFIRSIILMLGTLEMVENAERRDSIWKWIENEILPEYKEMKEREIE